MRLGTRKFTISGIFATAGALALLLAGCGSSSTATGPSDKAKDQTVKLVWDSGGGSSDIPTLDPAQAQDSASIPITYLVFDGLVTLDKDLKVELWGADKITPSADGLSYTFHIRDGQKFSDGTPVKASDYAKAIDRSLNPCLGSVTASYFVQANLKDADKVNGNKCTNGQPTGDVTTLIGDSVIADDSASTLKMVLTQPSGYFLASLSYPTSYAVEPGIVTGDNAGKDGKWLDSMVADSTHPTGKGGSGMFYVAKWNHTGDLVLKPNPNWWGKKPNFTEVDFKIFNSGDTGYSAYQSDQSFDFVDSIPVAQVAAKRGQPDFHEAPQLLFGGLEFNWKVAPFDDLNARKAFCLALDRDSISHNIAKDTTTPTWHIVPQGMPGYNPNLKGLDGAPTKGDVTLAQSYWKKYLDAHNNVVPPIKLSFNLARASQKTAAQYYQATWNQAFNINTEIDQTAWATILQEENSKTAQLFRFGWLADYPDPQDFLTLLFSTTSGYNNQNDSIPAADALMAQADQISDQAKQDQRMQLYNQAEQLLVDNVAYCPISQGKDQYAIRTYMKGGWDLNAQDFIPNDAWVNGYVATH